MGKKRKRDKADAPMFREGEIVLFRGERRTIMEVYPQYGNLGHYLLDGKRGERVVPIYSETYLRKIERD